MTEQTEQVQGWKVSQLRKEQPKPEPKKPSFASRAYSNIKKLAGVSGNYRQGYHVQRIPVRPQAKPRKQWIRGQSTANVTRFITGRSIPVKQGKGYASRGRPKGSYKYYIPGVGPVGVFEWRKYQRFKVRQQAMQIQQQNPDLNLNQAYSALRQVQGQTPIPVQNIQPQTVSAPVQRYVQPTVVIQQPQTQFDDGWGLLRIKSPFSLGGNGMIARPVNPIANAQLPVGNKYSAYYSEPDFISGQQVMKQRPNIGGFGLW